MKFFWQIMISVSFLVPFLEFCRALGCNAICWMNLHYDLIMLMCCYYLTMHSHNNRHFFFLFLAKYAVVICHIQVTRTASRGTCLLLWYFKWLKSTLQIPDLPKNNSNLKWDTIIGLLIFSRFSSPPPPPSPRDMSVNTCSNKTQHSKQKPRQSNICIQTSKACVLHTGVIWHVVVLISVLLRHLTWTQSLQFKS